MRFGFICTTALVWLSYLVTAFVTPSASWQNAKKTRLFSETSTSSIEEARALQEKARMMRLEADKLDAQLTLDKIERLERELAHSRKKGEGVEELQLEMDELQAKMHGEAPKPRVPSVSSSVTTKASAGSGVINGVEEATMAKVEEEANPIAGFDAEDLELYLPIARKIEESISTATLEEKLEAFRSAPELQKHFANKIQALLMGPMEDMQRLESVKSQYLKSTSSREKEQLKREIDALSHVVETGSPFMFSDSIYRKLPELTEDEIDQRLEAIEALPQVMQALYKKRNAVEENGDLRLAIQLEHYESQIQLLDQVQFISPLDEETQQEALKAYNSLPKAVQDHFCLNIGMDAGANPEDVIKELEGGAGEMDFGFGKVVGEASKPADLPEYSDVEFLDRSRYVEEFYPALARMEELRPTEEEIERFCSEILDKKTYTLTSKPERVMGGYYLRGINRFGDGEHANDRLVERISEKLHQSSLKDDLQFFYIPDPAPLTDEEIELGERERPLLVVTSKSPSEFYGLSRPLTKAFVSSTGLLSSGLFALGACGMNSATMDRLQIAIETGSTDVSWLVDMFGTTIFALLGIQLIHEGAHRLVAWKDKFDIGLPNLIASPQLGLTGAITPLKSPPKNWNSVFDFAFAGPMAGMVASLLLLYIGLSITASLDVTAASQLPALPTVLLHGSALGGGMVEFVLGRGILSSSSLETAVLLLHPLAIAGFAGLVSNALNLLPLGNTDGGRISLAMFGRRGSYLVKTFTTLTLCIVGLFGFDESNIFLLYALFTVLWQREPETPALNEVDDLDTTRGLLGIASAVLVALTLFPLQSLFEM